MGTKEKILDAALELFSLHGYEATSIGQIAQAVGVQKSSIYSHFGSKQDILDSLIQDVTEEFEQHSTLERKLPSRQFSAEGMVERARQHLTYILHDERISKVRKFLTIEQFRNARMANIQTKRIYEDVLKGHTQIMETLMEQSILRQGDAAIMAAQFAFPISVWLQLCDREPEREAEVMALLEKHIYQFFAVYGNPM